VCYKSHCQEPDWPGYVFELENGEKLIPYQPWCGTGRDLDKDPLNGFVFEDGKKVLISYKTMGDVGSICMAGDMVEITCLTEVSQASSDF
jgi:hypothetical protein